MQKRISIYKNLPLVFFLSFAVYVNHMGNSFHFDDVDYIVENPKIRDINHIYYVLSEEFTQRSLTRTSFVLNYYFGEHDPFGYHLINLFLHTLNGMLVLILVFIAQKSLSKNMKNGHASEYFIPLCAAVLFVIHPIQTESVVYIISRSELLSSFFYLLGFVLFQLFIINNKQRPLKIFLIWIGILLFFTMAIGSKQSSATFPGIVFLYYLIHASPDSPVIIFLKKWRYVIAGLALVGLLALFEKLFTDESFLTGPTAAAEIIGRKTYMLTEMFVVTIYYIKLLLFPINLNIDPDISAIKSIINPLFLFPSITLLGLIIWIFQRNRNKLLVFAFLWYIVTISPSSSIVTLLDFAAEHRLYLPSLGFFIIISHGLHHVIFQKNICINKSKKYFFSVFSILIIFFSMITISRNNDWRSSLTIWEDAVKKSPNKGRPYANLGYAYAKIEDIDRAIEANKKAIELSSGTFRVHYNLGYNFLKKGRIEDAVNEFLIALRLDPGIPETYAKLGDIYLEEGDLKKAEIYYKKAVEINHSMDVVFRNLGIINYRLKNYKEAYLYYSRSLNLNPRQNQSDEIRKLLESINEILDAK